MPDDISDRDLALAVEHPRGTEMRRLDPYRDALRDPVAYAALPERDRDVIVRWAEIRRRIADQIDADPNNVMERLVPAIELRRIVLAGECAVAHRVEFSDPGGDVIAVVSNLRVAM